MLSLNLTLARTFAEERFPSLYSPRLKRKIGFPFQNRESALQSPSALEAVDFEMSLDVEEQAALSLKLKQACVIMDVDDPEETIEPDASAKDNATPKTGESSAANESPEVTGNIPIDELPKAEENVKADAVHKKRKHTDGDDQTISLNDRAKPTALMPSPKKPRVAETKPKRNRKKRSAKFSKLSPEELARRFLDILSSEIELPADDLVVGKVKPPKTKNVTVPVPDGPIGWSTPPRHGSKKTRPFLIYEDPEDLEHQATPPSCSSRSSSASDNKENLFQEDTASGLAALTQNDGGGGESDNASEATTEISPENDTRGASPDEPVRIPGIAFLFRAGPIPVQLPRTNPSISPQMTESSPESRPRFLPTRRPRRRKPPRPRASDFF